MEENTLLIPKTIETFYKNNRYFRIHQIISVLFFIYYIYASIVNANDRLPWNIINTTQFVIAFIISISHIFIKDDIHWTYLFRFCIISSLCSFSFFIYWTIVYFSKKSRGNIAVDSDGQDMAGYFILFVWYVYLLFVSYKLKDYTY